MNSNNSTDKITVYKDEELLDLESKMRHLTVEETGFLLSQNITNENGRTMDDVAKDKIKVLNETNIHLENKYKDNRVAKIWLAVNQFTIDRLREDIGEYIV